MAISQFIILNAQFLTAASFTPWRITGRGLAFHCHWGKPPASPEDSSSSTVPGMVLYASGAFAPFPLTLTLSLREREPRHQMSGWKTESSGLFSVRSGVHPLPEGEGWGEGKQTTARRSGTVLNLSCGRCRRAICLGAIHDFTPPTLPDVLGC